MGRPPKASGTGVLRSSEQSSDAQALLVAAWQFQPDIVIADIGVSLLNNMDAGRKSKSCCPRQGFSWSQ